MKGVKFTQQTGKVAISLFTVYLLYGILYIPLFEYVSCLVLGSITYGITKSYELSLLSVLVGSVVFQFIPKKEGFTAVEYAPLIIKEPVIKKERNVQGVSSTFTEGFEGANTTTGVISVSSTTPSSQVGMPSQVALPTTTSVPASATTVTTSAPSASTSTPPVTVLSEQGVPPVNQPAETFQDNGGLFKLGQIPTDEKGGFHIDSGTSILNALKSLKPDQIQSMTQDTRQLIETQKSLMNMLQSFKPMMSEGKEMMATFQEMFSPTSTAPGSINGALQASTNPL